MDNENYNVSSQNFIPDLVYRTCREVTLKNGQSSNSTNITWHFNVPKNARHFVRVHFCDIISEAPNTVKFGLFIYSKFSQQINPYYIAVPFYYDFVVDSGDSDFISISVVPWEESTVGKFAFLNGLKIMEFITETEPRLELGGSETKTRHGLFIIIGSVFGWVLVVCSLIVVFLCKKRAKRKLLEIMAYGTIPFGGTSNESVNPPRVPNLNLKLKISFAEIVEATNNFEAALLIGEGGFGKVYKGTLRDGLKVAVKGSESKHGQGLPEFQTEVKILSKIRHRHLVSLIGYCDEGSEMILVYEFMERGTLRDHHYNLHRNPESSSALSLLTWKQRLESCIGAAKGLNYLHTGSAGGIIHHDIKSTNILLDQLFVAKVAYFVPSKSGLPDVEHSIDVKGTLGYLDPEYFTSPQLTNKSYVYAFAVVLLEVLCARPAVVTSNRREEVNLDELGMLWLRQGELEKIIDPMLVDTVNPNSLRKFAKIIEKCLKPSGSERPIMRDVLWYLEYALQLQSNLRIDDAR